MLLYNQEITEEIQEEIKKYLEKNDNENTNLFSISKSLSFQRMLYKWNHTVCNFLELAIFTQHNFPETHAVCLCFIYY